MPGKCHLLCLQVDEVDEVLAMKAELAAEMAAAEAAKEARAEARRRKWDILDEQRIHYWLGESHRRRDWDEEHDDSDNPSDSEFQPAAGWPESP